MTGGAHPIAVRFQGREHQPLSVGIRQPDQDDLARPVWADLRLARDRPHPLQLDGETGSPLGSESTRIRPR